MIILAKAWLHLIVAAAGPDTALLLPLQTCMDTTAGKCRKATFFYLFEPCGIIRPCVSCEKL